MGGSTFLTFFFDRPWPRPTTDLRHCDGVAGSAMSRRVPDYIVMVDVADGNECEHFQTQKTKLPGIRHIIPTP